MNQERGTKIERGLYSDACCLQYQLCFLRTLRSAVLKKQNILFDTLDGGARKPTRAIAQKV
jgi:hypothetical protein